MAYELVRGGPCPNCGAPIEFTFASSTAQVCPACRFVVARTDRDLRAVGRAADLVAIRSPFGVGQQGALDGHPVRVGGRVQYDRVNAASAPWQELFLELAPGPGGQPSWAWLAYAQGHWLLSRLYPHPIPLPRWDQALPGVAVPMPSGETFRVTERGERRAIAGEGELPFAVVPGQVERYVDLSGPNGQFGSIDLGDGTSPPQLYLGSAIDPARLVMAGGGPPVAAPAASMQALKCPGCGGNLPLVMVDRAERVICRYCGMKNDVTQGALRALERVPLPAVQPILPLGARGKLLDLDLTVVGFMQRGTTVEGERYHWREYLLYGGPQGFRWLMEEDGKWTFVTPLAAGDVQQGPGGEMRYRGVAFRPAPSVRAEVESVLGEFYWKVEVGEAVEATDFEGPAGMKISQEASPDEIVYSHCSPIAARTLMQAFPQAASAKVVKKAASAERGRWYWLALFAVFLLVTLVDCAKSGRDVVVDRDIPLPTAAEAAAADPAASSGGASGTFDGTTPPTTRTSTTSTTREGTAFSPEFKVASGGHNLRVDLSCPSLQNSWIGLGLALVNLDSGEVWEDDAELSYYSGVEGGESWSEGSRTKTLWYSRVPEGRYVLRMEHATDDPKAPHAVHLEVTSDTPSPTYMGAFAIGLFSLWIFSHKKKSS